MGVKDFHKDFLGRDTHDKDEAGVPKHSLDDLEAESVVAVDVMSSLYKALKTVPAANAFDTRPPIPLTPAVSQLKKGDLGTLLGYREDLKFIIVLDGADHEAKEIVFEADESTCVSPCKLDYVGVYPYHLTCIVLFAADKSTCVSPCMIDCISRYRLIVLVLVDISRTITSYAACLVL